MAALTLAFASRAVAEEPREPLPVSLRIVDGRGAEIDPARDHAALSRTLPSELGGLPGPDGDALRLLVIGTPDAVLETLGAVTLDARGAPLDANVDLPAEPATCPDGTAPELICRETLPLRLVSDGLDRSHPASSRRTLRAELGGVLRVSWARRSLIELPVGAPRELGPVPGRYRARLRVFLVRSTRGGAPPLGRSDAEAALLVQQELASAGGIWSQCGIDWGERSPQVEIIDPPSAVIVELGCGLGQPASGGELRIELGARRIALQSRVGESPSSAALRLAEAMATGGKPARVFENQRTDDTPWPTADLLLDRRATASERVRASSTDPTLSACVGRLDLNDGLSYFADVNAFSGTIEERALLRALDDGDPRTVEVVVLPSFERGERIGESFIVASGSSLQNAVIIDRAAIAAGAHSFALAHELGHVLLAMPGHPDDFGVDQSWSLMDSDAADASIFGPRRLSLGDCRRAISETGPGAPVPVLEPFPLERAAHPAVTSGR